MTEHYAPIPPSADWSCGYLHSDDARAIVRHGVRLSTVAIVQVPATARAFRRTSRFLATLHAVVVAESGAPGWVTLRALEVA